MKDLVTLVPSYAVYYHKDSTGSAIVVYENYVGQITALAGGDGWGGHGEWYLVYNPDTSMSWCRLNWISFEAGVPDAPPRLEAAVKDCIFNYLAAKHARKN